MTNEKHYLAVDLGASSGRVLLGRWDGRRLALEELHRFANGPVQALGQLRWDVLRLWAEIKAGLARYPAVARGGQLAGIAVDAWGVDYALLDAAGNLLGNPFCYRDGRTEGVEAALFAKVPRAEIFELTGIQFMRINTLYQLFSMRGDPQLAAAHTLLMIPDLFHYWLTGRAVVEYTNATTSQCFHTRELRWANELLARLDIPSTMLPALIFPCAKIGDLLPALAAELGLPGPVPVIAPGSHDTASAVAAVPGLDQHSAYLSSGTWSLMGVETAAPLIDERTLALNFTNEGGVGGRNRLLKNVMGLWLLQECAAQWEREGQPYSWGELLAAAERAAPLHSLINPDAPELLAPGDMPRRIRELCARSGQPIPAEVGAVVRCCLESLALRYRWTFQALEGLVGQRLDAVRVVGGGSQNHLLNQMTADACERPVHAGPIEATALGNIIAQLIGTGQIADLMAGRQVVAESFPTTAYAPRDSGPWQAAYSQFLELIG